MNGRVDRFQVSEGVRHEDRDSGAGAVLDGDSAGPGGRWHDDEVMQVVAQSAPIRLLRTGWPRRMSLLAPARPSAGIKDAMSGTEACLTRLAISFVLD